MHIFPTLFTERLRLRKLQVEDFSDLVALANNRKIADNILNIPHPYQEHHAVFRISYVNEGFKSGMRYVFALAHKTNDELLGEISLNLSADKTKAELGYWVGKPHWNHGYASEAIEAVLKFGFERLHLKGIFATCYAENIGSIRVLEKNGLSDQGTTGSVRYYAVHQPAK